jgi:hypothetical protein
MKTVYEITRAQLVERWENVERVLKALSPHERRKHWDMSEWGMKTDCGTVACAAGHCGLDPWFRRRGFGLSFFSTSEYGDIGDVDGFFGCLGTEIIFYDQRRRTVSTVIKEVRAHIKWLKNESNDYRA